MAQTLLHFSWQMINENEEEKRKVKREWTGSRRVYLHRFDSFSSQSSASLVVLDEEEEEDDDDGDGDGMFNLGGFDVGVGRGGFFG